MRELYGDVSFTGVGARREHTVGDGRFAVSTVALEGEFTVQANVRVVSIAFSTPGYRWRTTTEDGDLAAAPALFSPDRTMGGRLVGSPTITTVTFDRAALGTFAGGLYGEETTISFEGSRPVSPAYGRLWTETVQTIIATRALDNDISRSTAYQALAAIALEAFRLRGERPARSLSPQGSLTVYRRAADFVERNCAAPVTEVDIAHVAGVSVADLRVVYAAHSIAGWTPAQHLRRVRLAAVHVDLVSGNPARDRVSAIAGRWGFTNQSKFAESYREVFGVTPRESLGR